MSAAAFPDGRLAAAIERLRSTPIAAVTKGFGTVAAAGAITAVDLERAGISVFDERWSHPLLTLRASAVQANVAAMAAYCAERSVHLAPHGKTAMAPQLAALQLAAGAWGITVATSVQLRVYADFGVRRLLLANQLVEAGEIRWLASALERDPAFEAYCYVDSVAGVEILAEALGTAFARPLDVLIELGHPAGRTGARSVGEAVEVAEAAQRVPSLRVAGVAGYEGGIGHSGDPATLDRVAAYLHELRDLAAALVDRGIAAPDLVVSAGGSAFFDVVTQVLAENRTDDRERGIAPTVVLRSGAYVAHDDGAYAALTPGARGVTSAPRFHAALRLWASVLSRPEPGLVLLGLGRRDASFDDGMPIALAGRTRAGRTIRFGPRRLTALNDQHGYLEVDLDNPLAVGDLVEVGISHPCTTLDKWSTIVVTDDDDIVIDAVHTFF